MKNKLILCFLSFAIVLSSAVQAQTPAANSPQKQQAFRFTIPPSKSSSVEIKTIPNAECTLRSSDATKESQHPLTIFSNSEGIARFYANPSKQSEESVRVVVDCKAEGKSATYNLELRAYSVPTREMPAPVLTKMRVPKNATVRPALSEAEALRLPESELVKRHYPLPPGPKETARAYRAWVKAISVPVYMIAPNPVSNLNLVRKPLPINSAYKTETTPTWGGMELRGPAGSYAWIQGSWTVPSVSAESGFDPKDDSGTWIGIDGDGTTDLIQCGTEQEAYRVFWIQFTSYDAWTNFFPQVTDAPVISNFDVNPGDQIYAQVSIADADGTLDLAGAFAHFYMQDTNSSGVTIGTEVYTPVGSTVVQGTEAEWIEERPSPCDNTTQCPNAIDLANYGTVLIRDAMARKPNSSTGEGYTNCCGAGSIIITITNGTTTLSTVAVIDATDMKFTWHAYH